MVIEISYMKSVNKVSSYDLLSFPFGFSLQREYFMIYIFKAFMFKNKNKFGKNYALLEIICYLFFVFTQTFSSVNCLN